MNALLGFAIIASVIGVPVAISWWRGREARLVLEGIARAVEGRWVDNQTVKCTRHGQAIELRRIRGSSNTFEVATAIPRHFPLLLEIRRESFSDVRAKRRDELVDLAVGDPVFDSAFVVEGAPADVVARLIGKPIQVLLMANTDGRVVLGDDHELAFHLDRWPEHATAVEAIEAIAVMAAEVPAAFGAIGHDAPAPEKTPYREVLVERTVDPSDHNLELFELRERRRKRNQRIGVTGAIGLAVGVVILVRWVLLLAR